jgi:hypothetical protein
LAGILDRSAAARYVERNLILSDRADMARNSGARRSPDANTGKPKTGVRGRAVARGAAAGRSAPSPGTRVEAVMAAAQRSGLLQEKSARIGGRVCPALVAEAKARTGIEADTDLIEFALANIALTDKFAEAFKAARGKIDPDLKLGF